MARLGLLEILAVPVEPRAGYKAGQKIVGSNHTTGTDNEEADGGGYQKVGFGVDPFPKQVSLGG